MADEHVPVSVINALRSNGYEVKRVQEIYGVGMDDLEILKSCKEDRFVLLTNDSDFAYLANETEHSGVVIYTDQELPPRDVVRSVVLAEKAYSGNLKTRLFG
ncbi:MAG: DUF5615 family PIN-like protein [Halobacteria archaeon]